MGQNKSTDADRELHKTITAFCAEVVKLADTLALGASARESMRVQIPPSAPTTNKFQFFLFFDGLSQDRLAKLADVANNTIIKIEQGENINPTLDTLKKIAKALGVTLDEILN